MALDFREKTGLAKKNTLDIFVLHEKNYDNLSTIIDIYIYIYIFIMLNIYNITFHHIPSTVLKKTSIKFHQP